MANLNELTKVSMGAHYFDVLAPAGLVAGNAVELLTINTDGTYDVQAPTAITTKEIGIAVPVTLPYEADTVENDYVIATGEVTRVIVPEVGQKLGFPVANFTATATVEAGNYIILDAGALKMECVSSLGGTESVIYTIDKTYTKAGVSMVQIRCIKEV